MPFLADIDPTARRAIRIVAILLVFDVVLISLDLLRHNGVLHDARFAVTTERGFGEWFQYAKAAVVVVLLFRGGRTAPAAFAWAGLFAYLLVDDAFEIHERGGSVVASALSLPPVGPIKGSQLGELAIYAAVGAAFVVALWLVQRRDDSLSWWVSAKLALPFGVLVFFGAGVDLLHSALGNRSYRYAAGVIEDGGEMIAMTILLGVACWATRGRRFSTAAQAIREHAR